MRLTADTVRLGARAASKEAAIRLAGEVLAAAGHVAPGYVESMLARERQANTFLGQGIAIPHGAGADRGLVRRTGVSVVQLAEPVAWGPGQPVRLVVGIAAASDEHLAVLAALTDVLDDPAAAERLARAGEAGEIVAALAGRAEPNGFAPNGFAPNEVAPDGAPGALAAEARVAGAGGLHARPASALAEVASRFDAEVRVEYGGRAAGARSMASLLKLGVPGGEPVRLVASGPDAAAALAAVRATVEAGLGEAPDAPQGAARAPADDAPRWRPPSGARAVAGLSASPGLAVGPVVRWRARRVVAEDRPAGDPAAERRLLAQALEGARDQLADVHDALALRAGQDEAAIFRAHQAMLADEEVVAEVEALVDAGHAAAWAWERVIARRAAELGRVRNARLAARAADLHDVGQRVLRLLAGAGRGDHAGFRLPDVPSILVAEDLPPSDAARLDPRRILGLCTAAGGPTSHTAIIARALDVPAVVGAGPGVLDGADGATAVLDGTAGLFYPAPAEGDVASARAFQGELRRRRDRDLAQRYEPAVTTDGHRVEVAANIGRADEARRAVEAGAEGVGLMRTEFLFLDRDRPPSEDEQFEAYAAMVRALRGLPLVLRTLDVGGDKAVPYLALPREENPFLGVRGVRLCLRHPELFVPQLRAMYRAAALGPLRIMLPMVSGLDELRAARRVAEGVRLALGAPPVAIGIMVEVPSAALLATELAAEAEFFSVGTNDLTQYALAMDRMHPTLAAHADALDPAVLRLVELTVRGAAARARPVGVCGGVAGDPFGALVLAGLGVTELSMSPASVAGVKAALRRHAMADARVLARRALACATAAEVRALAPAGPARGA